MNSVERVKKICKERNIPISKRDRKISFKSRKRVRDNTFFLAQAQALFCKQNVGAWSAGSGYTQDGRMGDGPRHEIRVSALNDGERGTGQDGGFIDFDAAVWLKPLEEQAIG